jgi:creatinine amidohydrolase/Fe(II)-dependent formamide hydrolase-like protein
MASIFSLMIRRFTDGTANLDEVLGHHPGVHKPDLDGDTHGGLVETSQLLALHGAWVDPDYKQLPRMTTSLWLERRGLGGLPGAGGRLGFLARLRGYRAAMGYFNEQSYSGAPAGASAELGERFLDTLAEKAGEGVTELLDGRIGPEDCHSPLWRWRFLFLNPWMIRLSNRLLGLRIPIA